MDKFWNVVCDYYGILASEQDIRFINLSVNKFVLLNIRYYLLIISIRQYKMLTHEDLPAEKVFKGEISRLNSYARQKP
jgi:hypothetical protein